LKILIVGASGGIGNYLADQLCGKHEVYGTYNSRKPELFLGYRMDKINVSNESHLEDWVNNSASDNDDLALVYCVGLNYNCLIHKSDTDKWKEVIDSNLIGVLYSDMSFR